MNRFARSALLGMAAAAAALLGGAPGRIIKVGDAPLQTAGASVGDAAPSPPRLLVLPEGVAPVALNFPPPFPKAPRQEPEDALPRGAAAWTGNFASRRRLPTLEAEAAASGPNSSSPAHVGPGRGETHAHRRESASKAPSPPAAPPPLVSPHAPSQLAALESAAAAAVRRARALAERGAVYTARGELLQALKTIAHGLDAVERTNRHSKGLAAALRALEEGAAFQSHGGWSHAPLDLQILVSAHRTPVLKDADLQSVTPPEAMQHYYGFAQEQFAEAAAGRPAAAWALYGLGKLHAAAAERAGASALIDGPKALVFYQAALRVDPQHHLAANELGVLLARYQQWEEARRLLLHSLAAHPLPETWSNLAVVHAHLGETELAQRAQLESQRLSSRPPAAAGPVGLAVQWVAPHEFAALGERPIALAAPPALGAATARPGDPQWWKPWTWF